MGGNSAGRARKYHRLRVEQLEERWVPSGTFTWQGDGNSNNWSNAACWVGDAAPQSTDTGDILVFPTGTPNTTTNNDITGATYNSITLAAGYTVNGGTINLSSAGSITATGNTTINVPIQLAGASTFVSTVSGSDITFTGCVTAAGALSISGAGDITFGAEVQEAAGLTITSAGNITFSASPSIDGAGALTMSGTGNVNVTGNATVGGANVTSGILSVTGSLTNVTVTDNGTLAGNGTIQGNITATNGGWVYPSGAGYIGTLTATAADFSNGGVLYLTVLGSSNFDQLVLTRPPCPRRYGDAEYLCDRADWWGNRSCRCAVERICGDMQRHVYSPRSASPRAPSARPPHTISLTPIMLISTTST